MPPKPSATSARSPSPEESGDEVYDDDQQGSGSKGKRRGGGQTARRDQNRIAQREFRLRKQQRIRDLEAKVELLSAGKDEAFTTLNGIVRDLMQENQTLRQLVQSLSAFIGDGVGGFLPKLGWDLPSFQEFVSRGETDTMYDSFQARKKGIQNSSLVPPGSSLAGQKRRADDDQGVSRKKSKTSPADREPPPSLNNGQSSNVMPYPPPPPSLQNGTSYLSSAQSTTPVMAGSMFSSDHFMSSAIAGPSYVTPTRNSPHDQMQSTLNAMTTSSQPCGGLSAYSLGQPSVSNSSFNYTLAGAEPSSRRNVSEGSGPTPPPRGGSQTAENYDPHSLLQEDLQGGKKSEAGKLIHYRLQKYKASSAYCLPASLRPTLIQRTVAHDPVVDGIPFPDLRDKMILYRGSYDLAECMHMLLTGCTIHGDDVLAVQNWELTEEWFVRFGRLAHKSMLEDTNRWRRERGEPEISESTIHGSESPRGVPGAS